MTQKELADAAGVSYSMVRAVERGARMPGASVLDAIAAALSVDPARLLGDRGHTDSRVHDEIPEISRVIAAYDLPQDGPARPLDELRATVFEAVDWRVGGQYLRIARKMPGLLDLSARLVELMRWAAPSAEDPLLDAAVAYVRTETFFAARAHEPGLRALEQALDTAPQAPGVTTIAVRGALHMRAAVIAGRARREDAAMLHMGEARRCGDAVPERVYYGTAFGPSSARAHEVSLAVSLGGRHLRRALDIANEWAPRAICPPNDDPASTSK
ncbi:helix-turn-helix transcriptional regulator [Streptomyces oryzae]|uniref:helix-turn-helix transcriptional regulator n=1 Tax=Streptomyces oryzae TaxID=1434886 RepID=UPI0027DDAE15|nr:helix-turn-helix transcriptional regulator [Streptomyces oryzae]